MKAFSDKGCKVDGSTAIALGQFDGIHIGHQALIKTVIDESKEHGLTPGVFTFKNQSTKTLKKSRQIGCLINDNQKMEILKDMGIRIFYMVDFNDDIRQMTPRQFVADILVNNLNAKLIVVGFNYRFGYMGKGTTETLKELGEEFGFKVIVINPISLDDRLVSSSYIKELLMDGRIKVANQLLGRAYTLQGSVMRGKGRGKGLGFPTANLCLEDPYVLPKLGVYKTTTIINNRAYSSISNVGSNPTFGANDITIETYIFGFKQDIYGFNIKVCFEEFVREEKKFNSKEELINQMKKDIERVKSL